jgi:YD repeat-containing protein
VIGYQVLGIGEASTDLRITYDSEVDALYIRFIETTVATEHLAEGIAADYDAEGRLVGIEILDAMKRFGSREVFRQVVLEDIALTSA